MIKKNIKFENLLTKELKNKTILITGGAGSIGSAIAKRILKYPVKSVRILDINEHALFKLNHEANNPKLRLLLGSILDKERIEMASFGADIIIHSATKYLDGQGRCLGGAVLGKREHMSHVVNFLRSAGTSMSPFNAWVFFKGLETLKLRMDAHSAKAMELAIWLEERKKVSKVYYPGLSSHPQHELAMKQQ